MVSDRSLVSNQVSVAWGQTAQRETTSCGRRLRRMPSTCRAVSRTPDQPLGRASSVLGEFAARSGRRLSARSQHAPVGERQGLGGDKTQAHGRGHHGRSGRSGQAPGAGGSTIFRRRRAKLISSLWMSLPDPNPRRRRFTQTAGGGAKRPGPQRRCGDRARAACRLRLAGWI